MESVTAVLGVVLLLLLGLDVFVTVFHPEGHGGPLTRRQNRALWRVWRAAAPSGERRPAWLGLGGPVLALLTPVVWTVLLVGGFALIYYPWMEHFLVSPGNLRDHWAEALYFSGFAAATLGTGDIVPNLLSLRLLSILEALCGFALLSSALSYVLAIYRENGKKTTLAADVALHCGTGAANELESEPDLWLIGVARELQHIMQSHAQYPILHYFRPAEDRQSLTVQLEPLLRMNNDPDSSERAPARRTSRGSALVAEAVDQYLRAADSRFVPGGAGDASDQSLQQRYRRLASYLGYVSP